MDQELSIADPLAPNGGLLPAGTGNGLLKPCLCCRLARERNGRGAEYRRPAGPEWRPAAQRDGGRRPGQETGPPSGRQTTS
jgi:hypothetical protein